MDPLDFISFLDLLVDLLDLMEPEGGLSHQSERVELPGCTQRVDLSSQREGG